MSHRGRVAALRRRITAASLGLAALVLVPMIASTSETEAAWTNSEHSTTTVSTPTVTIVKGACTLSNVNVASGPQTATVAWTYPPASATIAVPNQIIYRVTNPNGTVGAATTIAVSNGTPTTLAFNVNTAAVGTYTVTIVPNRNAWPTGSTASWDGVPIAFSIVVSQNAATLRYFSSCA